MEKRNKWVEQLHVLREIAKIEQQAAHISFFSGSKQKFNYYMRTMPGIGKLLRKVNRVVLTEFIAAVTGRIFITDNGRKMLSLALR